MKSPNIIQHYVCKINIESIFISQILRVIGGWVTFLLHPDKEHIGTIDVDDEEEILRIKQDAYQRIHYLTEYLEQIQ